MLYTLLAVSGWLKSNPRAKKGNDKTQAADEELCWPTL